MFGTYNLSGFVLEESDIFMSVVVLVTIFAILVRTVVALKSKTQYSNSNPTKVEVEVEVQVEFLNFFCCRCFNVAGTFTKLRLAGCGDSYKAAARPGARSFAFTVF